MLTLDTQQLERQRAHARALQQKDRDRLLLRSNISNKEVTVAKDGDLTTTSLEAQLGTPLSSQQMVERLQKMNSRFLFEVAHADVTKMGIYVIEHSPSPGTGECPWRRFVTGMQRGYMPERSVRHIKKSRVPDPDAPGEWQEIEEFQRETRGWRTVLKTLLRERLITQAQIDRYFPANWNSRNWQMLTT